MINYYTLMNVSPTAPDSDLKPALNNALRQWTNRQNHQQLEKRQEAERNVAYLEAAKQILFDPGKRAEYDRRLAAAAREEQPARHDVEPGGDLIGAGWRYLAEGNIPQALYVGTKATAQQGDNPDAWALLAQAKFRWGDAEDAIYEYKRAIQLRPNEASLYFDLGSVYEAQEHYGDALAQYSRAATIDPTTSMYRAARGAVLCMTEDYGEGIPILEHCVSEDPQNKGFQWFLAVAYVNSAQSSWTFVPNDNARGLPGGYYATTRTQVVQAQQQLAKAAALRFDDEELSKHVQAVRKDIDSMMGREFRGSKLVPIVGGLIYSLFFGIGIVFAILYFMASRPPRYAINKYVLKGATTADDFLRSGPPDEGVGTGLIMAAIVGLFLPIMVIVNFVRYYTGENATPSS